MIIGGLWRASQIVHDPRIAEMVLAFSRWLERYGWVPQDWYYAGEDWRHGCQKLADGDKGGTMPAYWGSDTASLAFRQKHVEWYTDTHNPELWFVVNWARSLETDSGRRAALGNRLVLIENYFNPRCAAISDPGRMFNWQHRDAYLFDTP